MTTTSEVDLILNRVESLSAKISDKEKLNLIQRIAEVLQSNSQQAKIQSEREPTARSGVYFGKYADRPGPETTEADFKAAEYHLNEDEWR